MEHCKVLEKIMATAQIVLGDRIIAQFDMEVYPIINCAEDIVKLLKCFIEVIETPKEPYMD